MTSGVPRGLVINELGNRGLVTFAALTWTREDGGRRFMLRLRVGGAVWCWVSGA